MAEITKPIKVGNVWTNLISNSTGESVNFEEVTTWWDGTPMDDSKADGEVYRKLPTSVGGGYVRRVYDNFGQLFLEKDTMAEMRALSPTEILLIQIGRYKGVKLNGYYEKGDTPAPIEYYLSDTIEEDDGGSVFEVGGIKLEHKFDGVVDVRYFGAKSEVGFDNSDSFENASNYLANTSGSFRSVFYVPFGFSPFYYTRPLEIPANIHVTLGSVISYSGATGTALTCGSPGITNSVDIIIRIQKTNQSDWEDTEDVGVKILNLYRSTRSTIQSIQGFRTALVCEGDGSGFSYSKLFLGVLLNNKIDIWLTSSNNGWCNQNEFFGGNFARNSSVNNNKDKYGVQISSRDGTYINLNSNKFYSPSFEYRGDSFTDTTKEIIPIVIVDGQLNEFDGVRTEFNDYGANRYVFIRTSGNAQKNKVGFIYSQNIDPVLRIQDIGSFPSTVCYSLDFHVSNELSTQKNVISIKDVRTLILETAPNNGRTMCPQLNFATSSNSFLVPATDQLSLFEDSVQLTSTRGLAFRIDTRINKRFVARMSTHKDSPSGGRYNIRCFDETGSILNNNEKQHVLGLSNRIPVFNSVFGGVWRTGSDTSSGFYFVVSEETKYVDVIISGGSGGSTRIIGVNITSQDGVANVVKTTSIISPYSTVKPVDTTKPIGTFISDASGTLLGWKYTASGWEDIPNIVNATPAVKGIVNQAPASADTATAPSATYDQAEVQAILTELRDLKTKMRAAGLLAT